MFNSSDYAIFDIRAASALTGSYVAGTVVGPDLQASYSANSFSCSKFNQLVLLVDATKDTADACVIKIEYSHDGTNWFQDSFTAISGGTSTVTLGEFSMAATGKYVIQRPFKATYVRVSAKATGTVGAAAMSIKAIFAVA